MVLSEYLFKDSSEENLNVGVIYSISCCSNQAALLHKMKLCGSKKNHIKYYILFAVQLKSSEALIALCEEQTKI